MLKYTSKKDTRGGKNTELLQEKKEVLRKKVKALLNKMTDREKREKSRLIEKKIESFSYFKKARVIMFYWPLPGEPDIKNLIRKAKKDGKIVALPFIKQGEIQPYRFTSTEGLEKGPYGIWQPREEENSEVSLSALDLVFVPALAFDKKNRRLGRGKGYYDRFLKRLPLKVRRVGIAFSCQIFKSLPFSLQDEKVDSVIWA